MSAKRPVVISDPMAMTTDKVLAASASEAQAVLKDSASKRDPAVDKAAAEMLKSQAKAADRRMQQEEKRELQAEDAGRLVLFNQLEELFELFPEELATLPRPKSNSTEADLLKLIEIAKNTLASRQGLSRGRRSLATLLGVIEGAWGDGKKLPNFVPAPFRVDLRNISAYYKGGRFDDEVEPVLKQLKVFYPWLFTASLERQVFETFATMAARTDYLNKHGGTTSAAEELNAMPPAVLEDE